MKKNYKKYYFVLACFVLAITTIGTTYAYLTATTESTENAVNTGAAKFNISMEINPIPEYAGFSFIPMNDEDILKALRNKCKDKYGRGACSAYDIRVFDYSEELGYISGYMDMYTNNMENLSYIVLEQVDEYDEEKCVMINEKSYCYGKYPTSTIEKTNLSLGDAYNVFQLKEKHLLLAIWLTNLKENQNNIDLGSFSASVTILAGSGGEIKGMISSAIHVDPVEPQEPNPDNP